MPRNVRVTSYIGSDEDFWKEMYLKECIAALQKAILEDTPLDSDDDSDEADTDDDSDDDSAVEAAILSDT
jgi:hypothetical protein